MKFSYKHKKVTASLLVIILLINLLSFYTFAETNTSEANALAEEAMDDTLRTSGKVENTYNKIHFYVGDEDYTVIDNMTELKAVTSELAEISSFAAANAARSGIAAEEYQITVQFASDFMETDEYKAFSEERSELESIEEVREFRSRVNAFSKDYHEALVQKNIASLSVLECEGITAVEYSPFVVVTVDPATIEAGVLASIATLESIANISVAASATPESEASWSSALSSINAYNTVSNGTYTGEGIRIGIYESGGICNTAHQNLVGKNITVRDPNATITDHATKVTSVLTAISPDAEYYVSDVDRMGISWFIDQECDIINCSFGYYNNTKKADGTYSDGVKQYHYGIDGVYDYQIRANFIVVVKSAGNYNNNPSSSGYNPQRKISSPGYAYNVITVGGVDGASGNLSYDSGASYNCISPQVKPNVSAMFEVTISGFGICSGTSFATPQVAGCIALLMESNAGYCIYPERVMSVIVSTAQRTTDYSASVDGFDNRVGAGVINLQKMLDSGLTYRIAHTEVGADEYNVLTIQVNLTAGREFCAALAWMAYPVNTSTSGYNFSRIEVTDYNLIVLGPSLQAYFSELSDSNVEMLRFTVPQTGVYEISLIQPVAKPSDGGEDWVVLTYNF